MTLQYGKSLLPSTVGFDRLLSTFEEFDKQLQIMLANAIANSRNNTIATMVLDVQAYATAIEEFAIKNIDVLQERASLKKEL